ncbi:MAG: undecaprenyl/decaprenyl-phosphate alpha-N-acetylglucosaminyl 1-phosphate transferase [Acidobacteria bacterium]|nr:MAG: undecaprenyl/decaprenyl-phosphate alpha-N-acetylglucosaminyl 1-phosphate transferase [Acidobacteriota bacterium]
MTAVYLWTFALSLILSFVLTRYVRNLAAERGWLSAPTFDRHLHNTALPRLGGVAIFFAFFFSVAAAIFISWYFHKLQPGFPFQKLGTILIPGILIFLLGIYDDIRNIGPYVKFAVQAVAASMLFAGGLRIDGLPVLFGAHSFPWYVGLPLTILWVLAVTNAFNLIDGLDGLAAGSSLFSTLIVFVVALLSQSSLVALMTIALAGAILGFLRYNFNPATIFLGDCGSLFIGFLLSALALEGAQKAPTIIAIAIPVVSFGLPILETTLSLLRRLISGRPLFTADREHIHHKLLQRGLSHRQVVIVLYAVSALFALLSLFLLWPTGSTLGLVLAVLGTGIWIGVQHLGYLEFGELRRVAQRTMEQRQIFINNLAIRRATEELKATRDYDQLCRILEAAFSSNDFDAFHLNLKLLPNDDPGQVPVEIFHPRREAASFYWKKNGQPGLRDSLPSWNLTLDLMTSSNRRRGSMTIQRLYTQRDLQLDVNLLTAVFPVALADALDRVFSQPREVIARPEQTRTLVAVQAG